MDQSNISQTIIDTINSIFNTMFSSIDMSLYSVLDSLAFIDSSILHNKNFQNIFGSSSTNGILLIANSFLLALLLYFAIRYLFSHFTYSQIDKPQSFLIKLIVCGLCMNFSNFLIEDFINILSFTSSAICDLGSNLFNKTISFSELISNINSFEFSDVNSETFNIFSLDGLIKSILSLSLLNLVFSYSFRYIMVQVFILLSPFAILSASLSSTSWFFKTWLKNMFSLLFIQIIVSIVLVLLFSFDISSSDLLIKVIYIGGIYALIKANSFVREFIGGISTVVSQSVDFLSNFKR